MSDEELENFTTDEFDPDTVISDEEAEAALPQEITDEEADEALAAVRDEKLREKTSVDLRREVYHNRREV